MPRAGFVHLPAALVFALAVACAGRSAKGPAGSAPPTPQPTRFRVENAPRELQPALARAEAAVKTLRERTSARISAELASGGVARAIAAYRREAPALAAAISAQTGVAVGRTGTHPRAGAAPSRPWVAPVAGEIAARRAADVPAVVVDLGDRVGLLRPIALAPFCLSCHGPAERVLPEVKAAADGAGAPDRATANAEGDLRGFFWAEARK